MESEITPSGSVLTPLEAGTMHLNDLTEERAYKVCDKGAQDKSGLLREIVLGSESDPTAH